MDELVKEETAVKKVKFSEERKNRLLCAINPLNSGGGGAGKLSGSRKSTKPLIVNQPKLSIESETQRARK